MIWGAWSPSSLEANPRFSAWSPRCLRLSFFLLSRSLACGLHGFVCLAPLAPLPPRSLGSPRARRARQTGDGPVNRTSQGGWIGRHAQQQTIGRHEGTEYMAVVSRAPKVSKHRGPWTTFKAILKRRRADRRSLSAAWLWPVACRLWAITVTSLIWQVAVASSQSTCRPLFLDAVSILGSPVVVKSVTILCTIGRRAISHGQSRVCRRRSIATRFVRNLDWDWDWDWDCETGSRSPFLLFSHSSPSKGS